MDEDTGRLYAGARFYDPVTAHWGVVDPLADEFPAWSPYNYVMGNPLMLVDLTSQKPLTSPPLNNGEAYTTFRFTHVWKRRYDTR